MLSLPLMRRARSLLIAAVLALWVVSGPVGMAFDGCAMMAAPCEAPCGVLSYIAGPPVTGLAAPQPLTSLEIGPATQHAVADPDPLTPPPKSPLLSA
jgi:hypothetical protein